MEDSRPWLDMAHVISCLNKLDAGVADKICLMSRDEQNVLVVSYNELKRCLDQSFAECIQAGRQPPMQPALDPTMAGMPTGGPGAAVITSSAAMMGPPHNY